jgi:pimeloyl-ACP methyl ester carboxylesterase
MSSQRVIEVNGIETRVFDQGHGEVMLLLHGAWGGAEAHWGKVWNELTKQFRVVAPEIPGIMTGQSLQTMAGYTDWLQALVAAMDLGEIWCVGNSLGAAIGLSLATRDHQGCKGLVMVNGGWRADDDPVARLLLKIPGGRRLLRSMVRYNAFSPGTLQRAFAFPAQAHPQIVKTFQTADPPQLDTMFELFVSGDFSKGTPDVPTLVLWGKEDHMIGVSVAKAKAQAASIPGSHLVLIDEAGHLPQWEQPKAFMAALLSFVKQQRLLSKTPTAA